MLSKTNWIVVILLSMIQIKMRNTNVNCKIYLRPAFFSQGNGDP